MISISVEQLQRLIKAYEDWCGGSVMEVRACPCCPCRFRHKHGYVCGQVGVDLGTALSIDVLRICCPECGTGERIRPPWLSARSTYPLPVQEQAAVDYLSGARSYRAVARERGLDHVVLWRWVDGLARASERWVVQVSAEIVGLGGNVPEVSVDLVRVAYKSRSAGKAARLVCLMTLWPLLGALAGACRPWLADLAHPGPGMVLTFWSSYRIRVLAT